MPLRAHLDFETASTVDLRKTGAHRYAEDPSTFILCAAWAFDNGPVHRWRIGEPAPASLLDHIDTNGEVHAWNLPFEFAIWNRVARRLWGAPKLVLPQCHCTMARAAQVGLPLGLANAAKSLGLADQKDKTGHQLMLQLCKPRRTKDGSLRWWHEDEPEKLDRLMDYNAQDVVVEREVLRGTPDMSPREREIWLADREMNERGVLLDLPFVRQLQSVRETEQIRLDHVIASASSGAVAGTNKTQQLLKWVNSSPFFAAMGVKSLDKNALPALIAAAPKGSPERTVLLARKQAAKASVAKLDAAEAGVNADGRIRNMLQYFGAVRTGRWAGRMMQLQNLPRPPKGLDVSAMAMEIATGAQALDLRGAQLNPLDVISALIRATIIADPGHKLVVADFSQIEARVIAWLAGHVGALKVFMRGEDIYVYTAKGIGSADRQLGKVLVLACGYQMGGGKFRETAATYGIFLTEEQANELVYAWRRANQPIADLWEATNNAAIAVVHAGLKAWLVAGKLAFRMNGAHLEMRLPSTRIITYRNARLEMDPKFGKLGITYDAANDEWGKTRIRTYGGKLIENATQAIARDLLAEVMIALRRAGHDLLLTIHDELIAQAPRAEAATLLGLVLSLMRKAPKWAAGLPLNAAGFTATAYGKG